MPGKKNKIYHTKIIDRINFETIVERNSINLQEFAELKKNKVIKKNDWLFTLEKLKAVAHAAFECGWTLCQKQENPESRWSSDRCKELADKIIKDAFH